MKERKIRKTRWMWLIFSISWYADTLHCEYLSQKYQCEQVELLFKVPFYWLSVLFGVVDLILGIGIWNRVTTKQCLQPARWNLFSLKYSIDNIPNTLQISVDPWAVEKLAATYIIFVSVCSLMVDGIKFIS